MLTSKEVRELKKKANRIKDHVVIGRSGINKARFMKIASLLESHPFIKIAINKTAEKTKEEVVTEIQQYFNKSTIVLSGKKFLLVN